MPLTRRQREILDFISAQISEQGYAPSFEEIAKRFTFRSLATVHEHLTNLERKGYIRRAHNESRGIEVILTDTRHLTRVPGRKTDFEDCQWIQLLHSCGLLQGCFRPGEAICQLRSLVRNKAVLVAERSDWLRRMQKCLDQMNVRVHRAVSDIDGTTGMAILRAIVAGERDAVKLAKHRDPRCRKSEASIARELTGNWRWDHLFNLEQGLKMYELIEERIGD